jgi:hypothetical protein
MKCIRQIGSAWCEADFWMPTIEKDEEGRMLYRHVKGEFSRISIYAIGSKHITDEDLVDGKASFDFDLEDTVYLLLHPNEVEMQKSQSQRPIDNEYLFSVGPAARRWYELLAAKIFGVVENMKGHQEGFCEIRYSWYVERHHTLKRHAARYRVVEQMNDLIKDHRAFGYLDRVEYRAIKEPGQDIDYIIRYYPGEGARQSINRIRSYRSRNRKPALEAITVLKDVQSKLPLAGAFHKSEPEVESLMARLTGNPPEGFGVSVAKAKELIEANRKGAEEQLAAYPYRGRKSTTNLAGWLVKAIENNYELPPAYLEERGKAEQLKGFQAKKIVREACTLCDASGFRYLGGNRGVKKCTHDLDIESDYSFN